MPTDKQHGELVKETVVIGVGYGLLVIQLLAD